MIHFLRFGGRISRTYFWVSSLVIASLAVINYHYSPEDFKPYIYLALGILYLFQGIKRGHDLNHSTFHGFYWPFLPLYNIYAFIELYFIKGTSLENKYGAPPEDIIIRGKTMLPQDVDISKKDTIKKEENVEIIISEKVSQNYTEYKIEATKPIQLYESFVSEGDFVKKGQSILMVKSTDILYHNNFKSEIFSPANGYIKVDISKGNVRYTFASGKIAFALYHNDLERQKDTYAVTHEYLRDAFTNEESIKWNEIRLSYRLNFRLINISGRDFIDFQYLYPDLKLSETDKIIFLLDSNELIEFSSATGRYKLTNQIRGFRIPVYKEEIDLLCDNALEQIRIRIESVNQNIDIKPPFVKNYPKKDFQFVVKEYFQNFRKVVSSLESHHPLHKPLNNEIKTVNEGSCYVYLMIDRINGYHKIGISNQPQYREKTLQSEKPTIELICQKLFPSRKIAESIEKALHEGFKEKRIRGEWFDLSNDEINDLKNTLR